MTLMAKRTVADHWPQMRSVLAIRNWNASNQQPAASSDDTWWSTIHDERGLTERLLSAETVLFNQSTQIYHYYQSNKLLLVLLFCSLLRNSR
jgi:hypothetical protein